MQSKKKSKAQQYRDLVAKILEETVITSDEKLAEEVRRRIGAKRFTMNEYKSELALKDPRIDYTKSGSELIFYKPGVTAFIENLQSEILEARRIAMLKKNRSFQIVPQKKAA